MHTFVVSACGHVWPNARMEPPLADAARLIRALRGALPGIPCSCTRAWNRQRASGQVESATRMREGPPAIAR